MCETSSCVLRAPLVTLSQLDPGLSPLITTLVTQGGFGLVALVFAGLWWTERRGRDTDRAARETERLANQAAERQNISEMQALGIESARANQRIADVLQQVSAKLESLK